MNIVLIGYRGTGKSAVGALVGARLGIPCISADARIVEKAGRSIPAIVEQDGWPTFRDLETATVRELARLDRVIIDTGGGVIERPENIDALRVNGLLIWLQASVPVIVARIGGDTERPSLTGGQSFTDEVAELLARRTPKYHAAAQYEIDTDPLTVDEIAERVMAIWERNTR